ncbi:hypothetical protein NDU88_000972 [Pleurodeles waltl]|uniref:Reverse transcriptase domain-containing protein n=1 Tax=Pleurodeles waltl TaxID=8319 RepID=A0AAV7V8Q2_PLEWA|nr:hypothetical protein NDU88_000972 [Pleurodeles waltl]
MASSIPGYHAIHKAAQKKNLFRIPIDGLSIFVKLDLRLNTEELRKLSQDVQALNLEGLGVDGKAIPIMVVNLYIKAIKNSMRPLYTCLIDYSAAFDEIDGNVLWAKFTAWGIPKQHLPAITGMYTDPWVQIRLPKSMSSSNTNKGLKQGCFIAHILFNLHTADLASELLKGHTNLPIIPSADDLVILEHSRIGMKKALGILHTYNTNNSLLTDTMRTKVLIFGQRAKKHQLVWHLVLFNITTTCNYNYLGVWLSDKSNALEEKLPQHCLP